MGACGSSEVGQPSASGGGGAIAGDNPREVTNSAQIDKQLRDAQHREDGKVKLLLLGAGESGKSTIFKQMRILYGTPRNDEELRMYGVIVRANIIVAVRKILLLVKHLQLEEMFAEEDKRRDNDLSPSAAYQELNEMLSISVGNSFAPKDSSPMDLRESREAAQDRAESGKEEAATEKDWVGQSARAGLMANDDAKLFLKHWKAIKALWQSQTMKELWPKRAQANIIDGHKEYFQDIARIASPQYRPTNQDILNARVKTTTVSMERYLIDNIYFEMYDVGGQRSERRKWMECFDGVDAVIFVAALSEYDQSLAESRRTNRMVEALELFRSVANNRAFKQTSVMLFLNKNIYLPKKSCTVISQIKHRSMIMEEIIKALMRAFSTSFKNSKNVGSMENTQTATSMLLVPPTRITWNSYWILLELLL